MAGPGRILLTGGAGFIGSALARALVVDGWTVTVLDLLTYAGRRSHLDGVDAALVVGDVCDEALVKRLMVGQDAVVHAAAESHVARSLVNPAPFLRTNIEGARVVLEAAAAEGVPHAVHLSTDEVFGEAPPEGRFGPDAPLRPGNLYAATKAAAEALVHAIRHTYDPTRPIKPWLAAIARRRAIDWRRRRNSARAHEIPLDDAGHETFADPDANRDKDKAEAAASIRRWLANGRRR